MDSVQWQVSLANGETLYEGKGDFCAILGELSPWKRLIEYTHQQNTHITSLALIAGERIFNLPTLGNSPKFHAFSTAQKPLGFDYYHKVGGDIVGGKMGPGDVFAVAVAIFDLFEMQLWVNERDTRVSWVMVT